MNKTILITGSSSGLGSGYAKPQQKRRSTRTEQERMAPAFRVAK